MKLSSLFGIFTDLRSALKAGFLPTLAAISRNPRLLFQPSALKRLFMAHVWVIFAAGADANGRPEKSRLLPHAQGVVLDVGAGFGHAVGYLSRERITQYIALEPNMLMHSHIRAAAAAAGYTESDGSLMILSCSAEDTLAILAAASVHGPQPIDTIISVLTFCSIPKPERTLRTLVRDVLKPGGQFLFYEHVRSSRQDVAWWQRILTPLWGLFFDGCTLGSPTDQYIMEAGSWQVQEIWGMDDGDAESLFPTKIGRLVKADGDDEFSKTIML